MKLTLPMFLPLPLLAALFLSYTTILMAKTAPKDVIELGTAGKNGPVTFKHSEHIAKHKLACSTCHHGIKTDEEAKACSACHKTEKVEKTPSYKDALHKNCKDCHKKYKEDAAAKGVKLDALPTLCKHCHKKAK